MALVLNFKAATDKPNTILLNWNQPLNYNNSIDEIVVTKTTSHFPSEIFNTVYPTKATDSRPIEIFRGRTIVGINTGTISVSGNTLTDSSAVFPVSPNLNGRLIRDANSSVYKIISNTSTTITVAPGTILTNGKYVILADFPTVIRESESYEIDIRTSVSPGSISNLVTLINGQLAVKLFTPDELVNLVFMDGNSTKFIIKSNTESTIFFQETAIPIIGNGMRMLNSFFNTQPISYLDNFKNDVETAIRIGTGLLNDRYYYYTAFTIPQGANVAQAQFASIDSGTPTQAFALSIEDKKFGELLYSFWPEVYKGMDVTGDLQDLMQVFGFQFNQLHSIISTYRLQDSDNVLTTALLPLSEQFGLPSVGFTIGADTLRRIAKDMISCWKLKGSKEGIALFIREITTWDITGGTADFSGAVQDSLPNVSAFRFFDPNLGNLNTRFTQTEPTFIPGGRFAKGLPGVIIPGFFSFREFVITLPGVALEIGHTEAFTTDAQGTTMEDSTANFGVNDSLKGNYLLPNQEEINDLYLITSNTNTTITVSGLITNRNFGGKYAIFSPLNANRFIILNRLLPYYIPLKTKASFDFI